MSLTSYVKTEEIGHRIDASFPKPENLDNAPLLAPPKTKNYSMVGTAFDYVMRFWLQRGYPHAERKDWVANSSLILLGHAFNEHRLMKQCESIIKLAEERVAVYCRTGEMTDELLMSAIDLAKIDVIYRSGVLPTDLERCDMGDVQDLRRLYEIIPEEEFKGHDRILLNPTFGQASRLVGGADADLILDGRLIDIKTTKFLEIKKDAWRQIVGYGVLADLARAEDKKFPKIDEIGIYFSRHGKLWTVPATQIYRMGEYDEFRRFFVNYASKSFPRLKLG